MWRPQKNVYGRHVGRAQPVLAFKDEAPVDEEAAVKAWVSATSHSTSSSVCLTEDIGTATRFYLRLGQINDGYVLRLGQMQKIPQGFFLQPSSTQFTQPQGRGNP